MEVDSFNSRRQQLNKKTLFFPFSCAVSLLMFYSSSLLALPAEPIASSGKRMSAMKLGLTSQSHEEAGAISQSKGLLKNKLSNVVGQTSRLLDQGGQDAYPTRGHWILFNLAVSNIDALVQQGRDYYESGQFAQAATVWEQTLSSFATRGDGLNQAMVLSNLSLAYQRLGQWTRAKDAIAKSLDLLQSTTDTSASRIRIFAQALNTQGSLQLAQGQAEQALITWKKAEAAYRQANDDAGILRSQINQAQALKTLGFYRRALTLVTQVYQTLQQQPDSPLKAAGLRSLGSAFLLVGDVEQSRQVLQQSLKVAQNLQLRGDMSATLYDLGNTAKVEQDTNAALDYYQQAAAIATEPLTKIQAQLNQLRLLIETQQWSAARTLSSKIQSQLDNLPPSRAAIYAQIDLSMSLLKLSEFNSQPSDQSGLSQ